MADYRWYIAGPTETSAGSIRSAPPARSKPKGATDQELVRSKLPLRSFWRWKSSVCRVTTGGRLDHHRRFAGPARHHAEAFRAHQTPGLVAVGGDGGAAIQPGCGPGAGRAFGPRTDQLDRRRLRRGRAARAAGRPRPHARRL